MKYNLLDTRPKYPWGGLSPIINPSLYRND